MSAMELGAVQHEDGRTGFCLWAPFVEKVELHLLTPVEQWVAMEQNAAGYHRAGVAGAPPGSLYQYRLDGEKERPDPASRSQPRGVHGPSQVTASSFPWTDGGWRGPSLSEYIVYELHVGTFTSEGTFDAVIAHLDGLKTLGITGVELMPVAQFPGARNWGYDGVHPFAAQDSYGGPEGLKRLVDACHGRGLAVVLDVVYNHLGPEGNYLADFGPYFTDRYRTPWGRAVNFDGPHSDYVRRYFIENALYWVREAHVDALRLDAIHAIFDRSPQPFLRELAAEVRAEAERLGRNIFVIAESNLNDSRHISNQGLCGFGMDAQWNDDFHHSLRVLLTGDRSGYYEDFGQVRHLAKAFREGYVYSGEYAPFWKRRRGVSSADIPAHRFVVCSQNHDQVGNRMLGERLSQLVSFDGLKLAAGVVLLSPFVPLLFMGEEYGETAPFQYFISHLDPDLMEAVRRGRREEFAAFQWQGEPPDPQDEATFQRSKLDRSLLGQERHRVLREFYRTLLRLRKDVAALADLSKDGLEVAGYEAERVLYVRRRSGDSEAFFACNFGSKPASVALPAPRGRWRRALDSASSDWLGPGSALPERLQSEGEFRLSLNAVSLALYMREGRE